MKSAGAKIAAAVTAAAAAALVTVLLVTTSASAKPAPAAAPAATTTEVNIKAASVDDHSGDCADGAIGAHIILNQIGADRPDSISVTLSDARVELVPLQKLTGSAAHYELSFAQGTTVTDAVAVVPSSWTGQFVLSHYNCGEATSTTSSTTTPPYVAPSVTP